jgi:predicted ATPase
MTEGTVRMINETIRDMNKFIKYIKHKPSNSYHSAETNELLSYSSKNLRIFDANEEKIYVYASYERTSSFLKDISPDKHKDVHPVLARLKEFLLNCQSFEMLAPERIKHSSRGKTKTIGRSGEKLAAYLRQFSQESLDHFLKNVNKLVSKITSINTSMRGRPGWIELVLKETYKDRLFITKSNHISDGVLRIIALLALMEDSNKEGVILLDEIEDGLNPHITSTIIKLLRSYVKNTKRQILLTTHSSVMLDDFKPEEIIYLYRDSIGFIRSQKAFTDIKKIKDMLEYMNPGEIWLNVSETELSRKDDTEHDS